MRIRLLAGFGSKMVNSRYGTAAGSGLAKRLFFISEILSYSIVHAMLPEGRGGFNYGTVPDA